MDTEQKKLAVTSSNVNEKTLKLFAHQFSNQPAARSPYLQHSQKFDDAARRVVVDVQGKLLVFHFGAESLFQQRAGKKITPLKNATGVKNASKNNWLIFMEIEILIGS